MTGLIPNRMLMRFEIALVRFDTPPTIDGSLAGWDDRFRLPNLSALDDEPEWGDVYLGWHETGLYVACRVTGKTQPPRCNPSRFWKADNLRIMTDMRDTRTIHRASRFCQHWYVLPTGGGADGQDAVAASAKVNRAMENAPVIEPGRLPVAALVDDDGYTLEAHMPADCLAGFDPDDNPRIGLYTMLEDGELGQQYLTVGDEMPWHVDPSLWATAVLSR